MNEKDPVFSDLRLAYYNLKLSYVSMSKLILLLLMISQTAQPPHPTGSSPVLEYKVSEPKIASDNPPLLLLLHGVGSNEDDLLQLATHLPDNYLIVTARAPYTQARTSFKWYDVDFSSGRPVINYEQAQESRLLLKTFVEQLKTLHDFDHEKVIVGGFSQGAIMAYNLGITEPDIIHGVVVLSGRLIDEIKPKLGKAGENAAKILLIHGTQDRLLPLTYPRHAKEYLEARGYEIDYYEIEAGHTISGEAVQLMNTWLSKV